MKVTTIGELLYWSYANLAMAQAAFNEKAEKYGQTHYKIRARLYSGLKKQTMDVGSLAREERYKMTLPQACCYCGSNRSLSLDHLMPTKRGGANSADNLVWACRSCNWLCPRTRSSDRSRASSSPPRRPKQANPL